MYRINLDKMLMTKWTAAETKQKERHFIVSRLIRAADKTIVGFELEAVINKHVYVEDWRDLKDSTMWLMGWK